MPALVQNLQIPPLSIETTSSEAYYLSTKSFNSKFPNIPMSFPAGSKEARRTFWQGIESNTSFDGVCDSVGRRTRFAAGQPNCQLRSRPRSVRTLFAFGRPSESGQCLNFPLSFLSARIPGSNQRSILRSIPVAYSDSHPTLYVVSRTQNRLGYVLFEP